MSSPTHTYLSTILQTQLPSAPLSQLLKDGTILCRLANLLPHLQAKPIRFKNPATMPFVQMENISQFLRAISDPPISLQPHDRFLTVDLFEAKDLRQVEQCIAAFSRVANRVAPEAFPVTVGGLKEKEKPAVPPKKWKGAANGAQVGASVPWNPIQYGSMTGASQGNQGVSFGSRRQITQIPTGLTEGQKARRRRDEEAAAAAAGKNREAAMVSDQERRDSDVLAEQERRIEEQRMRDEEARKAYEARMRATEAMQEQKREESRKAQELAAQRIAELERAENERALLQRQQEEAAQRVAELERAEAERVLRQREQEAAQRIVEQERVETERVETERVETERALRQRQHEEAARQQLAEAESARLEHQQDSREELHRLSAAKDGALLLQRQCEADALRHREDALRRRAAADEETHSSLLRRAKSTEAREAAASAAGYRAQLLSEKERWATEAEKRATWQAAQDARRAHDASPILSTPEAELMRERERVRQLERELERARERERLYTQEKETRRRDDTARMRQERTGVKPLVPQRTGDRSPSRSAAMAAVVRHRTGDSEVSTRPKSRGALQTQMSWHRTGETNLVRQQTEDSTVSVQTVQRHRTDSMPPPPKGRKPEALSTPRALPTPPVRHDMDPGPRRMGSWDSGDDRPLSLESPLSPGSTQEWKAMGFLEKERERERIRQKEWEREHFESAEPVPAHSLPPPPRSLPTPPQPMSTRERELAIRELPQPRWGRGSLRELPPSPPRHREGERGVQDAQVWRDDMAPPVRPLPPTQKASETIIAARREGRGRNIFGPRPKK